MISKPKNKGLSPSITVFLFIINGFFLCAGFFILTAFSLSYLKKTSISQCEQNLKIFSRSLKTILPQNHEQDFSFDAFVKTIAEKNPSFRITIINSAGKVIGDSDGAISSLENHASRPEVHNALNGMEGSAVRKSTVSNDDVMYYASPFIFDNQNLVLRLSMPIESTVFFSTPIGRNMIFVCIIVFFAITIASFANSAFIVRRIDAIKKASLQYLQGNFSYRPLVHSPKELKELSDSVSDLAQKIQNDISRLTNLERVRKDFVANVSHELKTPVTAIKGFTETLIDGAAENPETARSFLKIIDSQCSRLMSIIEDLLTLSRLEQDDKLPELTKQNLVDIAQMCIKDFEKSAQNKNTKLIFLTQEKDIYANVNVGLLSQALSNILDNAIKYCPENSEISCTLSKNKNDLNIIIQDNGSGIPEKYQKRIFERFFRVDKGRSRETGGTGLGLSIASHIVKLHNGSIIEENRPDGKSGARFVITLPEYQDSI